MPGLFIAVPVTPEPALLIAQKSLLSLGPKVRVVPADQWHVTLGFLGELADEQITQVRTSFKKCELKSTVFESTSKWIGSFPDGKRPRTVVLGLHPQEKWQALADEIRAHLPIEAFDRADGSGEQSGKNKPRQSAESTERKLLRPHITLARLKVGRGPQVGAHQKLQSRINHLALPNARFKANQVVLYQSQTTGSKVTYQALETCTLPSSLS